jgi:hypothetical protein
LTRSSTERNQRKSPFFRLPGELRNNIYRYYLNNATIYVETYFVGDIESSKWSERKTSWSERTTFTRQENNLPLVCRQVHQESQPFHNDYHSLKAIIAKGFSGFMREVEYFSTRQNLGAIREVEINEKTAMDLLRYYEQDLASGDDHYWTLSGTGFWHNSTFSPDRLLPALEVVVWPGTASQVSPERREAAARFSFNRSDIQVVLSST